MSLAREVFVEELIGWLAFTEAGPVISTIAEALERALDDHDLEVVDRRSLHEPL